MIKKKNEHIPHQKKNYKGITTATITNRKPRKGEWERWGDVGQRIQTSSYKMNKFWGSNVQIRSVHSDYSS